MFHSGIDQHRRDCFVTTYASDAEVVKHRRVSNSATLIQRHFGQPTGPHNTAIESNRSWRWLADLLPIRA